MKKFALSIFILAFAAQQSIAQTLEKNSEKGWHLMDQQTNGFYGISLEKTYSELLSKIKSKKKIIVAVIDSGVDTLHEDLKSVLWKNKKEIPGNNIDDDKNGFIDDIYGWNFIGGKDGKNVSKDSYEGARVYYKLRKNFDNQKIDEKTLSEDQLYNYQIFQKAKSQLELQAKEASMYVMILKDIIAKVPRADSLLKKALDKIQFTGDELQTFNSGDAEVTKAKAMMLGLFQQTRQMEMTNTSLLKELFDFYNGEKSKIETLEIEPIDYRGNIVKDNYDDPTDRFYGNNDVMASGSEHGTHVSGIIGANRENKIGVSGIANNVEIMTVRTVPDGDEHDKDIANAIRYAVDNGAWVINMSFGKSFSPEKRWVDEAVKYAENKGVLLVHAAGNDAKNIDVADNFPSMYINNDTLKGVTNWINVGASGSSEEELAASFSNYGKRDVNVFAPGVKIYSTLLGGNMYGNQDGTSMAAPVVSGLAALILSYYPELTASQIKLIIEKSVTKIDFKTIIKPGTENEKTDFSELSKTGGIVNAYKAFIMASSTKGERKLALQKLSNSKK